MIIEELTGGGSTKSPLGKGNRMKTVKLVSLGSALVVMLSVMEDAGGVELDSCQLEQFRGASPRRCSSSCVHRTGSGSEGAIVAAILYRQLHARNKGVKKD